MSLSDDLHDAVDMLGMTEAAWPVMSWFMSDIRPAQS
jgi:hypothetical protein